MANETFITFQTNDKKTFYVNKKGEYIEYNQYIPIDDLKVFTWIGAKRKCTNIWKTNKHIQGTTQETFEHANKHIKQNDFYFINSNLYFS